MRQLAAAALLAALVVSACGGAGPAAAPSAAPSAAAAKPTVPPGPKLSVAKVQELAALFDDQPFIGGQVAPRLSKWITEDTFIFIQFDKFPAKDAIAVRYLGVAQKGVFCAEAQPDREKGSFTHFHRPVAETYAAGHGGVPGAQGFWMTWMATDTFTSGDNKITPGIDYKFSVLTPPACGSNVPKAEFTAPGQKKISTADLRKFAAFLDDKILTGGQTPPRLGKWLNEDVALFMQFDKTNPTEVTELRYFGIYVRGTFCKSTQPSADFSHYHRLVAPTYGEGHGGQPGETQGFWLMWMATQSFTDASGRKIVPGVDRLFSFLAPPDC